MYLVFQKYYIRVKHVLLLIYILAFGSGFAALSLLVYALIEKPSVLVRKFAKFFAFFSLYVVIIIFGYYLTEILSLKMYFAAATVSAGIYLTIGFSYRSLAEVIYECRGMDIPVNLLFILRAYLLAAVLCALLPFVFFNTPIIGLRISNIALISYYIFTYFVLLLLGKSLFDFVRHEKSTTRRSAALLGLTLLVLQIVIGIPELLLKITGSGYRFFSTALFVYLLINTGTIYFLLLSFKSSGTTKRGEVLPASIQQKWNLTQREAHIITLIAEGQTNREIALKLEISKETVRTHIYNIYQKTGAGNRVDLLNLVYP